MECEHKNKAYSPNGVTLTCYPPIHVSYWICKDCGHKGEDSHRAELDIEYDTLNQKFYGGSITIITLDDGLTGGTVLVTNDTNLTN